MGLFAVGEDVEDKVQYLLDARVIGGGGVRL